MRIVKPDNMSQASYEAFYPCEKFLAQHGLDKSYWGKKIIAADHRDNTFTESNVTEAQSWVTCACGKSSLKDSQRYSDGQPIDMKLANMGTMFSKHVGCDCPMDAARTLVKIENRVAELNRS